MSFVFYSVVSSLISLTHDRSLPADAPPISFPSDIQIARKSKATHAAASLTNGTTNGHSHPEPPSSGTKRKRSLEETAEAEPPMTKKSKIQVMNGAHADDGAVVIDDGGGDGAIIIDDD